MIELGKKQELPVIKRVEFGVYLGEQEGFAVGRIVKCRNARTSTQQLNQYPYLKTTLRESIVELVRN